jgi:hypothetical protein
MQGAEPQDQTGTSHLQIIKWWVLFDFYAGHCSLRAESPVQWEVWESTLAGKYLLNYSYLFNHLLNQQRILQTFLEYHAGSKVDGPP